MTSSRIILRVNPVIADLLHGEEKSLIVSMERYTGKQINIYPDTKFHLEEFDLFEYLSD